MRIVCPSCSAAYDVPDDRLSAGRGVRCSSCETRWIPESLKPVPVVVAPLEVPLAVTAPVLPVVPRAVSHVWVLAGWAATILIMAGALWAGYAKRDGIMHVWPPSERLYAALGLAGPR